MRVCLIYDCLFPHTVGGAERWYRSLAERLAAAGHEVTYLTLRQWERGTDPGVAGVDVRVVGPRMRLYGSSGRRRVLPPLVFGAGVLWHLLRHGRRYDFVHICSFPYFSLLAAALVRGRGRYRIAVDWFEVWTRAYWQEYLGGVRGAIGWRTQRLCARVPHRAFCFSRLHALRLREEGVRGEITILAGVYDGSLEPLPERPTEPLVVFAGRHIAEKRAPAVPAAIAAARELLPNLRGLVLGDGPQRPEVLAEIARLRLDGIVDAPGFVETKEVQEAFARSLCLLLPSAREGYGLVVIEAAAAGTPSIVVASPDNAAVELVHEGVNGFIAPSAEPRVLAEAIARADAGGAALRASTRAWFEREGSKLTVTRSAELLLERYANAR